MASEEQLELNRALREIQSKYISLLMTAAAAGIGFAVNQTHDAVLKSSQIPLGFSVLAWGLSFFFGCRQIQSVGGFLYANTELLRVQRGEHPRVGSHPERIQMFATATRQVLEEHSGRASFYAEAQFWMLVLGAILFVCWHILEMYPSAHAVSIVRVRSTLYAELKAGSYEQQV